MPVASVSSEANWQQRTEAAEPLASPALGHSLASREKSVSA